MVPWVPDCSGCPIKAQLHTSVTMDEGLGLTPPEAVEATNMPRNGEVLELSLTSRRQGQRRMRKKDSKLTLL